MEKGKKRVSVGVFGIRVALNVPENVTVAEASESLRTAILNSGGPGVFRRKFKSGMSIKLEGDRIVYEDGPTTAEALKLERARQKRRERRQKRRS